MADNRDLESGVDENTPILNSFDYRRQRRGSWCQQLANRISNCFKYIHGGIPARYAFAILSSFAFFNVYAMRVNLSVTMVAMVGKQSGLHSDDDEIACQELIPLHSNSSIIAGKADFDWDAETQAFILGAFFLGYVITQIPGGVLAEKYGGKWLFGVGILITAIFTLLTPLAAQWGVPALVIVRWIEGLGEGVTFPAMNALIGKWVPKLERSRIATIIYNGSPIGTVVSLFLSGYISASDELGGWPTVFYLFGLVGCFWFLLWALFVHDSPEQHPRISKEELQYIRAGQERIQNHNIRDIPWRSIFTSCPVWALIVTHFGYNWGFYTLLTELPTYLSNILHFELKQNGLLSAAPYVFQALFAYLASFIADGMRTSGRYRIKTIRKLMNSMAFFIPGILVGTVAFVGCMYEIIIILIVTSVAFSGFMYSGFNVTHVDMSSKYAGTLMGITNCVANLAGFMAPRYVGLIIRNGQTVQKWGIIFLTTSGIYFVTGMIFNFFGSAEQQPWGSSEQRPSTAENRTSSNAEE